MQEQIDDAEKDNELANKELEKKLKSVKARSYKL